MKTRIALIVLSSFIPICRGICAPGASPAPPDKERIMEAFNLMEEADDARDKQQHANAMKFYGLALDSYMGLARDFPEWKTALVRFRLAYCRDQLRSLLALSGNDKPVPVAADSTTAPPDAGTTVTRSIGSPQDSSTGENATNVPGTVPIVPIQAERKPGDNGIEHITSSAKALLDKGEFLKARLLLMEGISIDPDHFLVRLLLGVAQCEAGRFDDAAMLLKQLTEENPSNAHVRVALAGAYLGLGAAAEAGKEISAALKLKPDMPEAHYNMVQVLMAVKPLDRELARYHYRKAIEFGAKPDEKIEALFADKPDEKVGKKVD